jgi:cystathionine gamma-synthase
MSRWSRITPHSQPIFQTSVYNYPDLETFDDYYNGMIPDGYIYSRNGLPNSAELARDVAKLEHGEAGVVCSSGMSALLVALLANLKQGDHVVASADIYGGTMVLLSQELPRFGITSTFVDAGNLPELEMAAKPGKTKIIVVETISNPTLKVCDIGKIAKIASRLKASLIVDNTFATPFVTLPLELGADIVMHSGTKFLGGHHDLTLGVLCGTEDAMKRAAEFSTRAGTTAGPFDSWLARRSISTWKARVELSSKNAMKLAQFLEDQQEKIAKVYYPGLPSHPSHKLARRMFLNGNFGGMISFDLKGGLSSASNFVKSLSHTNIAPSLGGVETTISHPGKTSHRHITDEEKMKSGITDAMIRVSVGIKDYEIIEEDFAKALSAI